MSRQEVRAQLLRQRIAHETARIMVESGSRNFLQAKRKAAQRLGIADARHLPGNREVESALGEYQRLFHRQTHLHQLRHLRELGIEAMRFLRRFSPRLVGPVLDGNADRHSEVNLHLFSDTPEEVGTFLMGHGIPYEPSDRRLRMTAREYVLQPEFRFLADDTAVALTVFTGPRKRHAPLSPVDGRPMHRASLAEVESLLRVEPDETQGGGNGR